MKKNVQAQYHYSDALLLASIFLESKESSAQIWQIFRSGDYLDHAIFSFDEIKSGLARLIAGGYIKECPEMKFSITAKAKRILPPIILNIKHVDKIAKTFNAFSWNEDIKLLNELNCLKYPGLTTAKLKSELNKYFASNT